MKLKLIRDTYTTKSTIGKLYVDGVFECYTLEDTVREGKKVYGKTAINAGIYKVIIDMSNRFKCLMPLLLNVLEFAGVRIHSGNTDADTEGCILVGTTKAKDFVGESKKAYNKLFTKMKKAFDAGEKITIEIIDTK